MVSAMLMNITNFWYQLLVLLKKVLKQVNAIHRAFLWHGDADNPTPGKIGWDRGCTSKSIGGLGIRNLSLWNLVVVGKLAWHVLTVSESMWVKWVRRVYTKGWRWRVFNAPITSNWTFKNLF